MFHVMDAIKHFKDNLLFSFTGIDVICIISKLWYSQQIIDYDQSTRINISKGAVSLGGHSTMGITLLFGCTLYANEIYAN
jgi:hypothetical protein